MKKQKINMKKEKGITLIALIITIIILLILTVVSIKIVTSNGIINHAKTATSKYKEEEEKEKIKLAMLNAKMSTLGDSISQDDLESALNATFGEEGYTIITGLQNDSTGDYYEVKIPAPTGTDKIYKVYTNGELTETTRDVYAILQQYINQSPLDFINKESWNGTFYKFKNKSMQDAKVYITHYDSIIVNIESKNYVYDLNESDLNTKNISLQPMQTIETANGENVITNIEDFIYYKASEALYRVNKMNIKDGSQLEYPNGLCWAYHNLVIDSKATSILLKNVDELNNKTFDFTPVNALNIYVPSQFVGTINNVAFAGNTNPNLLEEINYNGTTYYKLTNQ